MVKAIMSENQIKIINAWIAHYMGYTYFEPNVIIEEDGFHTVADVFSKVPIDIVVHDGDKYFAQVPNPDYGSNKPMLWNSNIEKLYWSTINHMYYTVALNYHSSWDALMSVIDAIDCTLDSFGNATHSVQIGLMGVSDGRICTIKGTLLSIQHRGSTRIEAVYKSVAEFVETHYYRNKFEAPKAVEHYKKNNKWIIR